MILGITIVLSLATPSASVTLPLSALVARQHPAAVTTAASEVSPSTPEVPSAQASDDAFPPEVSNPTTAGANNVSPPTTPSNEMAPPPTPEDVARARTLFAAGSDAYDHGHYDVAIEAFEGALAVVQPPPLLFSTAQAHRLQYFATSRLEHLERAVALYRDYLRKAPNGSRRDHAAEHLAVLAPMLERNRLNDDDGARTPETAARIIVTSPTRGATARLDGGNPTEMPASFVTSVGPHEVLVEAPGCVSETERVRAVADVAVAVRVPLVPTPGTLTLATSGASTIRVDGVERQGDRFSVPPGRHYVVALRHGHSTFHEEVEIKPGATKTITVEQPLTWQSVGGYGALGFAGAIVAGALVPGGFIVDIEGEANAIERALQDRPLSGQDLKRYQTLEDNRDRLRSLMGLMGVGAVVFSGVGIAMLVSDSPEEPPLPPPPGPAASRNIDRDVDDDIDVERGDTFVVPAGPGTSKAPPTGTRGEGERR